MAVLNLTKVWINRLDSGDAVSAQSTGRSRSHDQDGQVRTYAGGRQRGITVAGERGRFTFVLRDVTLATIDILRSWIGIDVQVRDARGQRFTGVFFSVDIVEDKSPTLYDVQIPLKTVTVVEGV